MENIAYYNGKISLIEDMMIPMNERSSYFGDGVYDAMFTVDHVPLQLDDHLRRFYRSAKKIEIDIPMPFEELRAMVLDFCRKIDSPDAMAYVQATRGVGMRGHAYRFAGQYAEPVGVGQAGYARSDGQELQGHHDGRYALFPLRHQDDQPSAGGLFTPSGRRKRAATKRFSTAATA